MGDDLLTVGRVGRCHGVNGEVRIWPTSPDSSTLECVASVVLVHEAERGSAFAVKKVRQGGKFLIVALEGIETREQADAWKHASVQVPREALPALESPNEFYHFELVGLRVLTADSELGLVEEVIDNGGHDVLVVQDRLEGFEVMIPFVESVVTVLADHILVTPPEGLLEATRTRTRSRKKGGR